MAFMPQQARRTYRGGLFKPARRYNPIREAQYAQVAETPTGHYLSDFAVKLASAIGMGRQNAARVREEQAFMQRQQEALVAQQQANQRMAADLGLNPAQIDYVSKLPMEQAHEVLTSRWEQKMKQADVAAREAQEQADAVSLRRGQRSGLSASLGVSRPEIARLQREGMSPAQIREHYKPEEPKPPAGPDRFLPDGSVNPQFLDAERQIAEARRAPKVNGAGSSKPAASYFGTGGERESFFQIPETIRLFDDLKGELADSSAWSRTVPWSGEKGRLEQIQDTLTLAYADAKNRGANFTDMERELIDSVIGGNATSFLSQIRHGGIRGFLERINYAQEAMKRAQDRMAEFYGLPEDAYTPWSRRQPATGAPTPEPSRPGYDFGSELDRRGF